MQPVAPLVDRGASKWGHRTGVVPSEAEVVFAADTVQYVRVVRAGVDERCVASTVIVSSVKDIQSYKDASAFDSQGWILRITRRLFNLVESGMKVKGLMRDRRALESVSHGDARGTMYVVEYDSSLASKRHGEVAGHLVWLRLHRRIRKVGEEVFEWSPNTRGRFAVPIDFKLQTR